MRKIGLFLCILCVLFTSLSASPVTLFETGKELQYRQDWYGAIELYQQALSENPSYNAAYYGLAECFYALGEYDQAVVYIEKARRYAQHTVDIENLYAFILIGMGKVSEAQQIFSNILQDFPNNLDARFGMAEIEVSGGRLTNASELYKAALQRQGENRKALLSLALLSYETGNTALAKDYINRALQYHGDSAQVHYFAGYLAARAGEYRKAEKYVRAAITIQNEYDKARALLSSILYSSGRYEEAVDLADIRIAGDRNRTDAWYLKTLCLMRLNRNKEALKTAETGLAADPEDELMRILLEELSIDTLDFENTKREKLAQQHVKNGKSFVTLNMTDQALYEYRRALKVYPYDVDSREAYAQILLRKDFPERAIRQLEFIQSIEKSTERINDTVESYRKMLSASIRNRWNIDPLYSDKGHLSLGLFYQANPANVFHPEAEKLAAVLMTDVLSYNRRFTLSPHMNQHHSYTESFRQARTAKNDYFGIISLNESKEEIQIVFELYVGRTGSKATTLTVYRSGNNRYSNAVRRMTDMLNKTLPVIGTIVNRSQREAVIDIGTSDIDIVDGDIQIIKKDALTVANEGVGLIYNDKAVLGTLTVNRVGEDLSEWIITRKGYYDKVVKGDMVVFVSKQKDEKIQEARGFTEKTHAVREMSPLLRELRSIY